MELNINSTVQQLLDENHDPAQCVKINEVMVGHGLPLNMPISAICVNVAFITRPGLILYINERTLEA